MTARVARPPYPEEPVGEADSGALDLLAQRGQLLPQYEVLQREVGARSEGGPEGYVASLQPPLWDAPMKGNLIGAGGQWSQLALIGLAPRPSAVT